jgi:hypothetical protein
MNRALTAITAAALLSAPASATTLGDRWRALPMAEKVYVGDRVVDVAMTAECLHDKPGCRETSPFLGRHPSDAKLIGISALFTALHVGATMALNDRDPHAAKVFATVSAVVGAGVIGANFVVRFK